ncbi:transaldolase [Curtobacterium sp. PhB130]|uniref:transaldolase family protein n=1 Tax=unclassified Curtobacterium TaxID=257496 RepID=UPI000FB07090|nr:MULTISPECIES: transaldolase family protein [unclassified Curtobacterium]ROS75004.1 transaldolase [Curtobacterium sp. PhB130]TCK63630.1 transaldolase [Curtobacterium sp. PhB136]
MTNTLDTPVTTETDARPVTRQAAEQTPTALWNDSADPRELATAITEYGAVGATCNPVIAYTCIKQDPETWVPRIRQIAAEHPTAGESWIGWKAVEELSIAAAAQLLPAFEASGGRNGRLSMQTDPRFHRDQDALVEQAVRFSGLAPNIIVKIPATKTGIAAIEEAAYRGVSINATVSFSVAQVVAVGEAIERALDRRAADGLPEQEFGHVVTLMAGRLDDWLKTVVKRDHVMIDPGYLEWAGVAAVKNAYRVFRERGFRSRVLVAAFRNALQWSEFQGGDLVVSPPFQWSKDINANAFPFRPDAIDDEVPAHVLDALRKATPEFARGYDVDGMTIDEFERFGATVTTLRQFLDADAQLDALVRDIIVPAV